MNKEKYKCLLIADFTIDNFAGYLNNDENPPNIKSVVAPYGQVDQVLRNKDSDCWKEKPDVALIWTRPESVVESFNKFVNYENVSIEKLYEEVDAYSSLLLNISERVKFVFVPMWVLPSYNRGFGMLDLKADMGITNILMQMNLKLAANLAKTANVAILNTQRWISIAGRNAFNPKLWYMGKIAFSNEVFMEAVEDVKSSLRGIVGDARKLIILDLDDTLWGGILGDLGWENIRLGGHDHIGEAYVDFQRALKSLTNRGVILAIVSKNEEALALEVIKKHPEMVLKLNDFAGWRINWEDKAGNVAALAADLNLGLQSVVFIDDNPVERARVREALPEVFVPEWPEDKMLYKSTLLSLHSFDSPVVSKEDAKKTKMYVADRQRKEFKREIGSVDEWLKSLGMKLKVEELAKAILPRTIQLFNKTNQMNLATRRMTELELLNWAEQLDHKLWAFSVSDKFGDSGLTGIISLEIKDGIGRIVDFILSCRVLGRRIEEAMLSVVVKYAESLGLNELRAEYFPTSRNKPCLEFWQRSGFIYCERDNIFRWKLTDKYLMPDCVRLEGEMYEDQEQVA